ncbi:hypothetical protein OF83DRAFT_1173543 [Amylostereum chailletii]|nr:hypothetical protein OF83DRAFT_1173543 [Amylostereum chailletii]
MFSSQNHIGLFSFRQPKRVKSQKHVKPQILPPDEPPRIVPTTPCGTHIDLPRHLAQLRASPSLRRDFECSGLPESEWSDWADQCVQKVADRMDGNTVIYGARPSQNDPTIRHTYLPSQSGHPGFTIRWWYDYIFGYNFDLIDPQTLQCVDAPQNLKISYYEQGWNLLLSYNEGYSRARGRRMLGPPRWVIQPGALLLFSVDDTVQWEDTITHLLYSIGTKREVERYLRIFSSSSNPAQPANFAVFTASLTATGSLAHDP